MLALTIGGQAGAGGPEIGQLLARSLPARYIQHLAVRRLARRLSATVESVSRKELSFASRRTRVADLRRPADALRGRASARGPADRVDCSKLL